MIGNPYASGKIPVVALEVVSRAEETETEI
jgi:hypothetical protein